MPVGLRCFQQEGDDHFITFSCYRREPYFAMPDAKDVFLDSLELTRRHSLFEVLGYVVMPEHVHLLLSEPPKGNPSKILQILKQKTSAALRRRRKSSPEQLTLQFPEKGTDEKRFWQRRFYDLNAWSERKLREKLNYMHRNPVDRKLVRHPKDWPWSSFSFYTKGDSGLIRIDAIQS